MLLLEAEREGAVLVVDFEAAPAPESEGVFAFTPEGTCEPDEARMRSGVGWRV